MKQILLLLLLGLLAACSVVPAAPPDPGFNASMWESHRVAEMADRGIKALPLAGMPYRLGTDILAEGYSYTHSADGKTGTLSIAGYDFLIEAKGDKIFLRSLAPNSPSYQTSYDHPVMEVLIQGEAHFSLALSTTGVAGEVFEMVVFEEGGQ